MDDIEYCIQTSQCVIPVFDFAYAISFQDVETYQPLLAVRMLFLLKLIVSKKKLLLEGTKVDPPIPLQNGINVL